MKKFTIACLMLGLAISSTSVAVCAGFGQASQAFYAQASELDAMLKGIKSAEKATIEQLKTIVAKWELVRIAAANCKAPEKLQTWQEGIEYRRDMLGKAVAQLCQLAGHSELMNFQATSASELNYVQAK